MKEIILKCNNVYKRIKKHEILSDISFELYNGDVFGLIGPNGAGKTTLIKLILGLQSISSGSISINGYDVTKDFTNAIKNIGAIVENPDFYMYLSGRKNLELVCNCYNNIKENKIDEVVKLVGLEYKIDDLVSTYSLGMMQKLGIARSLLNNPKLLILDEPTNGLDPIGIKDLRNIIENLRKKGNIAILISSHILKELETLCNKICIIKNGKIIDMAYMNTNEKINFIIEVASTKNINKYLDIDIDEISNNKISINCRKEDISKIIKKLVKNNINVYSVKENNNTLEDKFFIKTGCVNIE